MNVLLILAAGKSSRFGGYPKAFCKIREGEYVAQRTVNLASQYFDKIYLAINKEIYLEYKKLIEGCRIICIGTGQGDAHSFLRAVRLIKSDCGADIVTLCWGDTYYLDDMIFKKAFEIAIDDTTVGVSFSSIESEPYAWYETDGDKIKASHFRERDGIVASGIHDQSVFKFKIDIICTQLELYMKTLDIDDERDYVDKHTSKEMKLLDSFTYFYENDLLPMKYSLVKPGGSYSFNTRDELEAIKRTDMYNLI